LKLFYVYKKEWDSYVEHRGYIVVAGTWQKAKGIAKERMGLDEDKKNIIVKEITDIETQGVLCATDGIMGSGKISDELK
jgi:hypothetical protein